MRPVRYERIDMARGAVLVSMVLYHGMWDLVYLAGWQVPWFLEMPGYLWQQSAAWGFILISGFCAAVSRGDYGRSFQLLGWSAAISAVTSLFFAEEAVYFGVLFLLGTCGCLARAGRSWLRGLPPARSGAVFFLLFLLFRDVPFHTVGIGPWEAALPAEWYTLWAGAALGFPAEDFRSLDYFPLLPWVFLYFTGYMAGRSVTAETMARYFGGTANTLARLGKHSLLVYLLHQPVLLGLFQLGGMLS